MNITLREINLQYVALQKTFDYMESKKYEIQKFFEKHKNLAQNFVGCGSSYNLCQSGEFLVQNQLEKKSIALAGGDLMLNFNKYINLIKNSMTIMPSRSGSTSEILFAAEQIKKFDSKLPILSIVCKTDSKISKISDLTLEIPWAFDESVCQTRSVTNLYVVLLLLIAYFANDEERVSQINQVIKNGDKFLETIKPSLKEIAQLDWTNAIILGDGEVQGIACEGALAFTEISRTPGSYYHFLDVRHGPMVLVSKKTLVLICISNNSEKYSTDLINDLIAKGATVILYSPHKLNINGLKLQLNPDIKVSDSIYGINFVNIPQLLSYYKAGVKNINPDQPDGLDAWINLG